MSVSHRTVHLHSQNRGVSPAAAGVALRAFAFFWKTLHRGVEQLVARRAHNPKVVGSSPAPATKEKAIEKSVAFFI